MVNFPAPSAMIHAPATSQLPVCGNAKMTPRPAASASNAAFSPFPGLTVQDTIRSRLITCSRNTSIQ